MIKGKWESIDKDKIGYTTQYYPCHVEYYLYSEKGEDVTIPKDPEKEFNAAPHSGVCFSSLPSLMNKSYNRICYKPSAIRWNRISKATGKKWIEIAIKGKLLPEYISPDQVDGYFAFKIDKKMPISLLYVYLATIRDMEEESDFVNSVVQLVDKHSMDIYAAIVIAAKLCINGSGHFYLLACRDYYGRSGGNIFSVAAPLKTMIGLRRFLNNPQKYDSRTCYGGGYYNAYTTIEGISHVATTVKVQQVYGKYVLQAIYSDSDEEAKVAMDNPASD